MTLRGARRDEIHVVRGDASLAAHSGGPCNCHEVFLRCGQLCTGTHENLEYGPVEYGPIEQ